MLTTATHMLLRRTVKQWFRNEPDFAVMRAKLDNFVARIDGLPRGWHARHAGAADGATLYLIEPAQQTLPKAAPLVLYFHGGGYITGGLKSHGGFCARLARAVGGRVLFVDYRLAPEHTFPAALQDGLAALHEAATVAGGPLLVAGDSAGGGLALAVTQAAIASANGTRLPDALILISPWADLTLSGASMVENGLKDSLLSTKILTRMRAAIWAARNPPTAAPRRCSIRTRACHRRC